jgi:hypothetical protein
MIACMEMRLRPARRAGPTTDSRRQTPERRRGGGRLEGDLNPTILLARHHLGSAKWSNTSARADGREKNGE